MSAAAGVAPVARADTAEHAAFMGGSNADVFRANLDGSGLTQLTHCATISSDCIFYWPALSPDGQVVALESGWCCITLLAIDGSSRRVLINDPVNQATLPAWAPDGRSILFTRKNATGGRDLYSISTEYLSTSDGSNAVPIITGPGFQEDGDYSPNGASITYEYKAHEGEPYEIWIAYANGTGRTALTSFSQFSRAEDPHFSPDGTKITFDAIPASGGKRNLYVMNSDGSGMRQLTSDSANYYSPTWSPDGSAILVNREPQGSSCRGAQEHIGFVSATAEPPSFTALVQPPYPAEYECGESIGSTRKPSAWFGTTQELAARFRPSLFFDSEERWRPLNIDSAMKEPGSGGAASYNELCSPTVCEPILSNWEEQFDTFTASHSKPYLKLGHAAGNSEPYGYRSPYSECASGGVLDCNGGSRSSIYYHTYPTDPTAATEHGYRFVDYWVFYRYNHFPADDHEGDWEGLAIAYEREHPGTLSMVGYRAHGSTSWYLPGNVTCGPSRKACGAANTNVDAFVAQGSHATYPTTCDGHVLLPLEFAFGGNCQQSNGLLEGSHDGAVSWSNNIDTGGALVQLPPALGWPLSGGFWTDWPGHWGSTCAPEFSCEVPVVGEKIGDSPESPGKQQPQFSCPSQGSADTSACTSRVSSRPSDIGSASRCPSWLGSSVAVLVCSPSRLSRALSARKLGHRWPLRVEVEGQTDHRFGSGGGLTQITTPSPTADLAFHLSGRLPSDTGLWLRLGASAWSAIVRVSHLRALSTGERMAIRAHLTSSGVAEVSIFAGRHPVRKYRVLARRLERSPNARGRIDPAWREAGGHAHFRASETPAALLRAYGRCLLTAVREMRSYQRQNPDLFRKLEAQASCPPH